MKISRRDFLTVSYKSLLTLGGLLGLSGLWRFLAYQPDPAPPTTFDLGLPEAYLPGSRTLIPEAQAVLVREENDFKALSLICPHLGCTVELTKTGFDCPCHGSRFNASGALLKGPAVKAMQILRLELNSQGRLILHTD
jgi:Rieske Fe-S protein